MHPRRVPSAVLVVGLVFILIGGGLAVSASVHAFADGEDPVNQSAPVAPPDFNSTERLLLPGTDPKTGETTPEIDPTMATASEFRELELTWEAELLEKSVDAEADSEGKVQVLEEDLDRLEAELERMNQEEAAAFQAFHAGEISAGELAARVAELENRGALMYERLEGVREATRGITSPVVESNVTSLQANVGWWQLEAESFQGPIRGSVWDAITAERSTGDPIVVQATADGYSLQSVDDVMYTRELYHGPNHDRAGGGFLSTDDGGERMAVLYPWTYAESFEQEPRARGDIFRERLTHPHGTTTTYLSGPTELPYREIHDIDLAAIPTVTAASETLDEYEISVERTYAGGPAMIAVTDNAGEPAGNATVTVDEQTPVELPDDGILWVVTTDDRVFIEVGIDDESTSIEIELPVGPDE